MNIRKENKSKAGEQENLLGNNSKQEQIEENADQLEKEWKEKGKLKIQRWRQHMGILNQSLWEKAVPLLSNTASDRTTSLLPLTGVNNTEKDKKKPVLMGEFTDLVTARCYEGVLNDEEGRVYLQILDEHYPRISGKNSPWNKKNLVDLIRKYNQEATSDESLSALNDKLLPILENENKNVRCLTEWVFFGYKELFQEDLGLTKKAVDDMANQHSTQWHSDALIIVRHKIAHEIPQTVREFSLERYKESFKQQSKSLQESHQRIRQYKEDMLSMVFQLSLKYGWSNEEKQVQKLKR